jgi:hypothetical protein
VVRDCYSVACTVKQLNRKRLVDVAGDDAAESKADPFGIRYTCV